jgi:hypothetical protein
MEVLYHVPLDPSVCELSHDRLEGPSQRWLDDRADPRILPRLKRDDVLAAIRFVGEVFREETFVAIHKASA